ncbi:20250_t:CDS:2 [Funneliformis geosporum]|uniref:4323_t:CDS:1 n=1 Tax=Funneliformis geosporum TaxID=1117311 RepID=A0A9W4X248_9GLOM|nr:20250_t:CDS:2 [Funneliformis geosporum]CAI2180878.1 4323_t:CDS:2 [Funneliformis geosporum]
MTSSNSQSQKVAYEAVCLAEEDIQCNAITNPIPLPGKILVEPLTILLRKPSSSWTKEDVTPIAKLLAGRPAVDGAGENFEGAQLYASICEDFATYLYKNPDIRAIVDPLYVVADLSTVNVTIPANIYPPGGNPPPPTAPLVGLLGINHAWIFNGRGALGQAQHFIGWLQGTLPGIRVLVFTSPNPVLYY